MKTTKKLLLAVIISLLSITATFAQTEKKYEFELSPTSTETILGVVTIEVSAGEYKLDVDYDYFYDSRREFSKEELYEKIQQKAKDQYASTNPNFALRDFKYKYESKETRSQVYAQKNEYWYKVSATVVITDPKLAANENLSKAIDKALMEVREGSRIAIDQIRVITGIDKEDYKDEVVEILLEKGFKVVAKEYLEKLYEEQQNQQSGIYNDRTTVKENNFSAVGYYLNVRLTETALRVQVIDVSSGEYVGNVTIKLQ